MAAEAIGEMAGRVWQYLNEQGPVAPGRMARDLGIPRTTVDRAIGWLAREEKLKMETDGREEKVALK